jgi:hypothetical protein
MLAKRRTDQLKKDRLKKYQLTMASASPPSIVNLLISAGLLLVALVLSGCSALSGSKPVMLYMAR